jgi:DNA-binding transcriptional LysR family regulator
MLDLEKLATLRAVLAHGSFSRAAEARSLTQPAVSRQVALLERRTGLQLVRRTRQGVLPTEAGRRLADHATAVLDGLAQAEAELADLAGLRSGEVRLGAFFTALVHLSAEAAACLEARHPGLVIRDELVDRREALRRLAAGELDLALVFEHAFEPAPAPARSDLQLVALFDDPPRILLPAGHPLATARSVTAAQLAGETWIRAHDGSAARLVDHVLGRAGLQPAIQLAGHGDEPVEAQALVAAGRGVTIAHQLNVLVDPDRIRAVPLAGGAPVRHVQAATLSNQHAPAARALLDVLQEIGRRRLQLARDAQPAGRARNMRNIGTRAHGA